MDIRTLDLNLLKTFNALFEERSVTRAATRLALSQPAVSGMLNRLRESFDDPLFVRTQRGIMPTPRAEELSAPIKRVLADIESMLRPASFDPASADFTLSVAATDYAQQAIVVPFFAALRQLAPRIRVDVHPIDGLRLQSQLERGDLDLALLTPETTPSELHARRLFDERYVCVLRSDHPDANSGSLSLDRFCTLDHAILSYAAGGYCGATDMALAKAGRERHVALSMPSFLVVLDVLRSSNLVALMPRRLVAGAEGLAIVEPPFEIPGFTKVAAWHTRSHDDPAHQWVRALLVQTCGAAESS